MKVILRIFFFIATGWVAITTATTYAKSHQFGVVNNSPWPVSVTIKTTDRGWYRPGSITQNNHTGRSASFSVAPFGNSNAVSFNTGIRHAYSVIDRDQGIIRLALGRQTCFISYHYNSIKSEPSYFKRRSLVFDVPVCRPDGTLKSEITAVNDSIKAIPRSLVGNLPANLDRLKAAGFTEALSLGDCGGKVDNCLVISPSLTTRYQSGGSTLQEALNLQAKINEAEPFGFEQFMGTHNSVISREYTYSVDPFDLSHSDPNQFIPVREMLQRGIRQLEMDIVWYDGKVRTCHNHQTPAINFITCKDNTPLTGSDNSLRYPFREIQKWARDHPDDLVMVYFDINQSLNEHVAAFNKALKTLSAYMFTPAMARKYYHTSGVKFPMKASARELLRKYHKNIIMFADEKHYLTNNPYLFSFNNVWYYVQDTVSMQSRCVTRDKYKATNNLTGNRGNAWYRVDADRSVFSYLHKKAYSSPENYHNDFTATNLRHLLYCPINIFSTEMLGYTCDSSSCHAHPSDPRMASLLWSWQTGYPLKKNGAGIAVINHITHHFTNDRLRSGHRYNILCVKRPDTSPKAPVQGLSWYVINKKLSSTRIKSASRVNKYAQSLCRGSGGVFAAPVTSYWMDDAIRSVPDNKDDTIVNYQLIDNHWIPNNGKSIITTK